MKYYAAQIKTRGEEKYIKLFHALNPEFTVKLYFPQRELKERRGGQIIRKRLPVFSGYIFAEIENEKSIFDYSWTMRHIDGFLRFLKSNLDIRPLEGRDLEIALHFIKIHKAIAGISKVYFNENDRVVVLDGALKGLEGNIIKIDKRKGRAKVKLDMFGEGFLVDLAFDTIVKPAKSQLSA